MPALDRSALKQHIDAGRLAPVYLFVGEDVKLVDRMVDAVESTIDPADRPFAVDRLYAGDMGGAPADIAASCRGLPMLGDRRLVIVLRAERFLKPKRAGKASETESGDEDEAGEGEEGSLDLTPLEEYVASPSSFATLVFVATAVDKSRRFTKRVVEKAQVVVFGGIRAEGPGGQRDAHAMAERWVREELVREGRAIEPAAVRMLVERAGGDISKLRGDIERLLLYTDGQSKIAAADVDEVAADGATAQDDWAVVNAIGDGDAARALRELALRFDRGDSPHGIVGQLRWWVSTRMAETAPERVKPAIDALFRTDLALKSSGGEERVLVERLVVELTGRPVPRWGGGDRRR